MFREAFYISVIFFNVLISPKFAKSNHDYRCRDKADLSKDGATIGMIIDRTTTKK